MKGGGTFLKNLPKTKFFINRIRIKDHSKQIRSIVQGKYIYKKNLVS